MAIQSKIYETAYRTNEAIKREHLVMSYIKSLMRVILRQVRGTEFNPEQARQVLVDLAFISDVLNEQIDKEEETILAGFFFTILSAIRANTIDGDVPLKTDKVLQFCQKKKAFIKFL